MVDFSVVAADEVQDLLLLFGGVLLQSQRC
jgi:hypothetical protein